MAGFHTHVTVSTACGLVYGAAVVNPMGFSTEVGLLAASVTAVGGMIPDLDSDSGVPVREVSGLAAAVVPLLMAPRLLAQGHTQEGVLATLVVMYILIRYVGAWVIKRASVHRGMYHSIPAMLIAGMVVFLEYKSDFLAIRVLLACGMMIGFFSHLLLDEIYSVDFHGVRLHLNKFAGSAIKFLSPSWSANCICYGILTGLAFLTYLEVQPYLAARP